METQCNQQSFGFHPIGRREIVAKFDGGRMTSDGGGLLLRETERLTGIIRQFATCFTDHRNPDRIEHTVEELVAQCVYTLALGYQDLNDHDHLRTIRSWRCWQARRIHWGAKYVAGRIAAGHRQSRALGQGEQSSLCGHIVNRE